MARQNRRDVFDSSEVSVFHCIQRAVRRAWLCGKDPVSGKSFEHRRGWIQGKLQELASSFGIDCLSFAVMVNHLHVMLRNRPDVVATWSDEEVARRWWRLFPSRRDENKAPAEPTEFEIMLLMAPKKIAEYRRRLSDISWFMRALAEPIARKANHEDECRGRFWEGRFKSQKLADETALLACSAYVDLNPVRAGAATTPEESEYTSVHERIASEQEIRGISRSTKWKSRSDRESRRTVMHAESTKRSKIARRRDDWLSPIEVNERSAAYRGAAPSKNGYRASDKGFLAMSLDKYLKLLDWTGRQLRKDHKRGKIPDDLSPILERIGLSGETWCDMVSRFSKIFKRVAGSPESLAREAIKRGQQWLQTHNSPLATQSD